MSLHATLCSFKGQEYSVALKLGRFVNFEMYVLACLTPAKENEEAVATAFVAPVVYYNGLRRAGA